MREIKFRAWDTENNSMQYDYFYICPGGVPVDSNNQGFDADFILMQYTGLKDKNGTEIYEGDIVYDEDGEYSKTCKIEWYDENAQFVGVDIDGLGGFKMEEIYGEIIGNIYENPELLK